MLAAINSTCADCITSSLRRHVDKLFPGFDNQTGHRFLQPEATSTTVATLWQACFGIRSEDARPRHLQPPIPLITVCPDSRIRRR
jgi:hypothetical protein